jgi:hypothetical protein
MKTRMSIALFALWMAWGSLVSPARAQSALERLERQIRQRTETPKNTPPDAERPPAAPSAETPRARGDAEPGYLGLVADDQKDRGRGVRVIEVYGGSPAEKAGIRRQDLITSLAGVRVRQMTDLSDVLETLAAGQGVDFEVLREEKPQKVRVTLGQRPAAERPSGSSETVPLPPGEVLPERPERRPGGVQGSRLVPPPPSPKDVTGDETAGPQLQPPTTSERLPTEASRLEQLQRRVDELERRVAELERAMAETLKKKP